MIKATYNQNQRLVIIMETDRWKKFDVNAKAAKNQMEIETCGK
jgi:hypothetical protein